MIYHYTCINKAKQKKINKKSEHTKYWPRYRGTVILIHCWSKSQMAQLPGRRFGKYCKEFINKYVPYDLIMLFLAIT